MEGRSLFIEDPFAEVTGYWWRKCIHTLWNNEHSFSEKIKIDYYYITQMASIKWLYLF